MGHQQKSKTVALFVLGLLSSNRVSSRLALLDTPLRNLVASASLVTFHSSVMQVLEAALVITSLARTYFPSVYVPDSCLEK